MIKTDIEYFDGFAVNLFYDDDGDWLAHFVEMPNISAFADTPDAALNELRISWEGVKESYRKHGEAIPKPSSEFPSKQSPMISDRPPSNLTKPVD